MITSWFPRTPSKNSFASGFVDLAGIYTSLQAVYDLRAELPEPKDFGDLTTDAISTLDANSINMFEFIGGFKNPKELLPKLRNLQKLKTHAGNYLGVQYGVLPTVSDLKTLYEAITAATLPYFDSNNYQVLTAGRSDDRTSSTGRVEVIDRIKIAINPSDPRLFTLSEKMRNLGGFPSIDNLWELVPYSFVIDWFVNVGDMLEEIDTRYRVAKLPIVYATRSTKVIFEPNLPETLTERGALGDVKLVYYDRTVSEQPPLPTLNFEVSNSLPSHWLEAGALIVARK